MTLGNRKCDWSARIIERQGRSTKSRKSAKSWWDGSDSTAVVIRADITNELWQSFWVSLDSCGILINIKCQMSTMICWRWQGRRNHAIRMRHLGTKGWMGTWGYLPPRIAVAKQWLSLRLVWPVEARFIYKEILIINDKGSWTAGNLQLLTLNTYRRRRCKVWSIKQWWWWWWYVFVRQQWKMVIWVTGSTYAHLK